MTVKKITTSISFAPLALLVGQKQEGSLTLQKTSSPTIASRSNTSLVVAVAKRSRLRRFLEKIFTPPWRKMAENLPSVRGGTSRLRRLFEAILALLKRVLFYFFDKKETKGRTEDSPKMDKNGNDLNSESSAARASPITFSIDDEGESKEPTERESSPVATTPPVHPIHHVDTFPWPERVRCKVEATIHVAPLINPSGTGWGTFIKLDSQQSEFTLYSLSGKGRFWRWETHENTIPDQFGVRSEGNGIYACIHLLPRTHRPKIRRFHCLSPQLSPSQIVALLILAHGGRFSDPLKSVLKYKQVPKTFINDDGVEQDVLAIIRNAAVKELTFSVESETIPTSDIRRGYFHPVAHKP